MYTPGVIGAGLMCGRACGWGDCDGVYTRGCGECHGNENATFGRGGGVEGPGEGEVDDAGEEKERTFPTGLGLKRACRSPAGCVL